MNLLLLLPTVDTCYEFVPPVGVMNLFLIAKAAGWNVRLLDLSREPYASGLERVLAQPADLIGVSCNFTNGVPSAVRLAQDIKRAQPNTVLVAGGNHATLAPEDLLSAGYDWVVAGEGELTFREFLNAFPNPAIIRALQGLCYLEDGKVIHTPRRELIQDLDSLPFNDYSDFDLGPYFKWAGMRYINIESSRGCIYHCSFCATSRMWGHRFRHKSPQRIVREFAVARQLGCHYVFFCDDDTALDENYLREFCSLLVAENILVPWGTTIGSASVRDESTFDLMRASGCIKVNICIESANARLLKAYRKPFTIEDNRRTCAALRRRSILVHNHGIIGAPDETILESLRTYFYLIRTSPIWHVSVLEPRPGSIYWRTWSKKGMVDEYARFGKANVILSKRHLLNWLMYRVFVVFYLANPLRIWLTLFARGKAIRYNYRIHYYVAYKTVVANFKRLRPQPRRDSPTKPSAGARLHRP